VKTHAKNRAAAGERFGPCAQKVVRKKTKENHLRRKGKRSSVHSRTRSARRIWMKTFVGNRQGKERRSPQKQKKSTSRKKKNLGENLEPDNWKKPKKKKKKNPQNKKKPQKKTKKKKNPTTPQKKKKKKKKKPTQKRKTPKNNPKKKPTPQKKKKKRDPETASFQVPEKDPGIFTKTQRWGGSKAYVRRNAPERKQKRLTGGSLRGHVV